MRPLGVLCCVYGVLGPLAPVHQCAGSVCCVGCGASWATWLLFTGVPARCVVLRVRCPGPLGSCSPVCPLGVLCCVYGVLGHLTPVHRCARSVCCVACAVSWATSLLLTDVLPQCVVLRVRCPGPFGSCSPVCPLGVLCCAYVVLAPWLLFTGVLARCGVLWVACAVLRVRASLRGAHSSIRTAAVRSRQGLGTLRARTHPSGRRLFRSRQGPGTLRAGTRPSGRRLFRRQQGLGSLPGAHTSVRTAAGVAWHLFSCRGSLRVVDALRVCGTRRLLLLGTCPCALVVAGGAPLWRSSLPRVVRHASSSLVAPGAPVGFPDALVPFPNPPRGLAPPALLSSCAGHAEAGREPGSICLPLALPRRGR